ncbi:MAG TPA: hypothetical protein VER08_06350 [Pyrinomonadaceae bacterium]|nr:hypothetical protein [Pyrinomonadaceae bacterium]
MSIVAKVDRLLGWTVVLLGVLQCLSTPRFFREVEEPAAWFFAGGLLLITVGALSLLRLGYGADAPGVRRVSLAANVVLALFWAGLYGALFEKFARHPASFAGLFVVLANAAASLLNSWRARSPGG